MKNKLKNNLSELIKIPKSIATFKKFNINPEYIKIISFDVANKSLAIAQLEIINIKKIMHQINNIITDQIQNESRVDCYKNIIELLKYTKQLIPLPINFLHLEVCDVIPGKKVSETTSIDRANGLYTKLNQLCKQFNKKWISDAHILIEYQMGQNKKSGEVASQIIYHFLQYIPPENIHIIGPSLKNKLYYLDDVKSTHNYYVNKFVKLYDANKAHTKYLFNRLIEIYKLDSEKENKLTLIKKRNYPDIADAICQAIAWVKLE